jgi:hypothetical protein
MKFYDLKTKKSFETPTFKTVKKGSRRFAVAISPNGTESWRILGKE